MKKVQKLTVKRDAIRVLSTEETGEVTGGANRFSTIFSSFDFGNTPQVRQSFNLNFDRSNVAAAISGGRLPTTPGVRSRHDGIC